MGIEIGAVRGKAWGAGGQGKEGGRGACLLETREMCRGEAPEGGESEGKACWEW